MQGIEVGPRIMHWIIPGLVLAIEGPNHGSATQFQLVLAF
jgi:hypothetical protein